LVSSVDSDEATLLDVLETDLNDFFFGCEVEVKVYEK